MNGVSVAVPAQEPLHLEFELSVQTEGDAESGVIVRFNGTPITVNFAGKVKGDTVQGNVDVPGAGIQPFPFTAVKAAGFAYSSSSPATFDRPRLVAR